MRYQKQCCREDEIYHQVGHSGLHAVYVCLWDDYVLTNNHLQRLADLVSPIRDGDFDMVLGSRLAGKIEPGAMPWHQQAGNKLAALCIRWLYGLPVTDLSPFRAVRRESLLDLRLEEMTYGWPTEMIVKASRRGWRICEIPVSCHRRLGGKSKISGTFRGTVFATWLILSTIFRYTRW